MNRVQAYDSTRCPTAVNVRAYAAGCLDEANAVELEQHLATCRDCETILDAIEEPSDALLQAISAIPPSDDDEPAYRSLRDSLEQCAPQGDSGVYFSAQMDEETRLADPPLGPLPRRLAGYELLSCIGRGASGAVYRARHLKLDQTVAIKVLDVARIDHSQAVVQFFQEMKTVGQLAHPNIVRATDAGEADGFHFLVMEYVDGVDASRLVRQIGPLNITDACEIARKAALGLQFAHEQSLVHRDVKPSNLLVTISGGVKLLDLGIAVRSNPGGATMLGDPAPIGTLCYMAPEQRNNATAIDARADLYSLGRTMIKLLTGQTPEHRGPGHDPSVQMPPPAITLPRGSLPRKLQQVIARLLADDPRQRPASAGEVAQLLEPWAKGANLAALVANVHKSRAELLRTGPTATTTATAPFSRRLVIGGIVAAGTAAILARRGRWPSEARLRRAEWRDLVPTAPKLLLAVGGTDEAAMEIDHSGRIAMFSRDLALVDFGRPVSGVFRVEVQLQQKNWSGGGGLFFRYRRSNVNGRKAFRFQTVELRPPGAEADFETRLLLWSEVTATQHDKKFVAHRSAWAEVVVPLSRSPRGEHLQLVLGLGGLPEVHWNDQRLEAARWKFSTEGRDRQRLSADQLPYAFLGRLGLVNALGRTTFVQPRLAYL